MTYNRFSITPKYILCVDSTAGGIYSGRLFCGCMPDGKLFRTIEEAILIIDGVMSEMGYPQSTVEKRSFKKPKSNAKKADNEAIQEMRKYSFNGREGNEETFVLQINFRKNASWQGIMWAKNDTEPREFQSVLQLVRILDSVCTKA